MKNQTILLTGANRGIGRALLERLAAENRVIALVPVQPPRTRLLTG